MRRKQTKNRRERVQYCTCVCNQESIHDSKLYLPLSIYNYTVNLNKSHDINAKNQNIGESQTACYLQYLEQTINILYYEHRWNL